jgi:hypothetical protein
VLGKPGSGREVIVAMKYKKSVISIALATIMLVSMCTVVCSTSVTAADSSRKTAQAPATVGGALDSTPAAAMWKIAGSGDNFQPAVAAKSSTSNQPYFLDLSAGTGWVALGGATLEAPGIASGTPTQMVVSVRGTDGALWWKQTTDKATTWSPSATGWKGLGGQLLPGTSPAVYAFSATSIGWLVVGTDHQLWWMTWNGQSHSSWKSLQGYVVGSPAVVTRGSTIDVYVGGSDAAIWQKSFVSGVWQKNWASRGSDVSIAGGSSPTASVYGTTREDLFWLGTDGALHQKTWNGGSTWTAATTVPTSGATIQSSPSAAAGTTNSAIDIELGFAGGIDGPNGDLIFASYFTYVAGTPPTWQQTGFVDTGPP